ncbi:MAG: beta-lactamase family protein, partial [Gammaproteobacteria bacterium]|nr:beta-lactamase family protein [Gammaproteobacteria bacterium]
MLAVLVFLLPVRAHADNITPLQLSTLRYAVSELIRKEMKDKDIEALSIALVEDQQVLWSEGFGVRDSARGTPAKADTLYAVGGLSQLLTATAVMQLAERGTLDLDQPLTRYLPEFSIRSRFLKAPPITPRLLLAHRSGLPGMHFKSMWTPNPEPLASFVASLKNEYTAYPPGQIFTPSFPGYDVLGRIVETQCRKPFATCLQEQVLTPLGMKHSTFDILHADPTRFATHYWNNKPYATQAVRDIPAAGLASSVNDLARYVQMVFAGGKLDGRQVLSPRSVAEMLRVQNDRAPLDLDNHVGMPWRLAGVRFPQARTVAWLNNDSPFSRGRVMIVPEHKLGVIVLTNCAGS